MGRCFPHADVGADVGADIVAPLYVVCNEGTGKVCNSYSETFHNLRHTCATLAFLNDVPLRVLSEVLGRKDIRTARALNPLAKGGKVRTRATFEALAKFLSRHNVKERNERAYESLLELPRAIVLAVMWLTGIALMGLCTLALYLFWLLLQTVA